VELDWSELVRHVSTRWLSLTPVVKRLLQNWPALKSYFQSIDDCPKFFSKLFYSEDTDSEIKLLVVFNFFVNVGELLDVTTKILQKSDLSIMDSYKSMTMIRNKINQRIQDQYFGNSAKQFLKKLPQCKQKKIVDECCDFYSNLLQCLGKKTMTSVRKIRVLS
jgi:hypothetical protein